MFDRTDLREVWTDRVRLSGQSPFLRYVDPAGGSRARRSLTYAQCDELVKQRARELESCGVRPGDRVVVHMPNGIEMIVAMLAAIRLEAVVVPTILQYAADELAYVVGHSGARVIVTDEPHSRFAVGVAAQTEHRPAVLTADGEVSKGLGEVGEPLVPSVGSQPGDAIAMMMYTSGTTARPKGVMLSHQACLSAGYSNAGTLRLRPDDVLYCVLPLFHVNAMAFQLLPCIVTGSCMVLSPGFSARAYWDVVRDHGVTVGNLTNGPVRILLDADPTPEDTQHRMRLMCYALPLEANELAAFRTRFTAEMSMGWGLTETMACGTRTPAFLEPRHTWQSIGMVADGWELRIVDDEGNTVPDGQVGEALVRGPALMSGYFRDPVATADAMGDGWLRTGDLLRLDSKGYVFFEDRKKDIIKVKGENVAAGEVERVVNAAPGVADSAAIGVPDRILGERLVVVVVPDPATEPSAEQLTAWCAERLAGFKVPSEFTFVEDLPRTSIGKISKNELKGAVSRGRP